jgi:hypothetical protein
MAGAARVSVALTTWFKLSGQGMQKYEFLTRGSAFAVREGGQINFLCAAHTAAPWAVPSMLAAAPWLKLLDPSHVRHMVEVRSDRGQLLLSWPFKPDQLHVDAQSDVAVLGGVQDESRFSAAAADREIALLPLSLADRHAHLDEPLWFCGHDAVTDAAELAVIGELADRPSDPALVARSWPWPLSLVRDAAAAQRPLLVEGHALAVGHANSNSSAAAETNFIDRTANKAGSSSVAPAAALTERSLPEGMSGGPVLPQLQQGRAAVSNPSAAAAPIALGMTTAASRRRAGNDGTSTSDADDPYTSVAVYTGALRLREIVEDAQLAFASRGDK